MQTTPKKSPSTSAKKRAGRRAAIRRRPRSVGAIAIGAGLLGLFGLVAYGAFASRGAERAAAGPIEGLAEMRGLERSHVPGPVAYPQTPPVGGNHNPVWQNCGVYDQPIQNENGVHTLEHGAVWITYRPDLSTDQIQQLQSITRQSPYRMLTPYPDLPSPIVVSAWGYQVSLEQADDPRLMTFIQRYELNPAGPEPGAPCTGGVGQPG